MSEELSNQIDRTHPNHNRRASEPPGPELTLFIETYIDNSLAKLRESDKKYFDEKFKEVTEVFKSGFPNGDIGKHRAVHEGYITKAEENKKFWFSIKEKIVSGAIWSTLLYIGFSVVEALKHEVKK